MWLKPAIPATAAATTVLCFEPLWSQILDRYTVKRMLV